MLCSGIDVFSGSPITVSFNTKIDSIVESAGGASFLAPGFIDIQINGFLGIDFNNPALTVEQINFALDGMLACGVTRCLPTVITGDPDDMLACLKTLRKAQTPDSIIAGFHVEGPHIGAEEGPRGAHPLRWVRKPDLDEYSRWQEATDRQVRIVTVSPHWQEAPAYIAALVADGVVVSIGHTGANADQISAAVDAGATMSTHLGNGAHGVMRRHPNYLWDQLAEDRLTASFIVDGIHLGKAFLTVGLRAKGLDRSVLITDAAAPAGAAPGRYRLGEQDVDLTPDDKVQLVGTERLAGSALKMHKGVANLVALGGLSLADAVRLATVNPARAIRLEGRGQGLKPGETADLIAFQFIGGAVQIERVYVAGQLRYQA